MKILYITYDGISDPLGQSQILPYLLGLSQKGFEITLVSCEKPLNYRRIKNQIQNEIKDKITWIPITYSNTTPLISQYGNLKRIRKAVYQLTEKEEFQIVHCRSYMAALIGLELKKKYNIKYIFDMRGFWADERIDGKIWNIFNPLHRLLYNYFKIKEKAFLNNADAVVSLTEKAKIELLAWKNLKLKDDKIFIIPCCVDVDFFSPNAETKTDPFTLSYVGSIGTWYLLDEMLLFFKILLNHKPEARFLFITRDNPLGILKSATALNLPINKIIIQAAERSEVPFMLSKSHLSIFFIKPAYSKIASSPTKLGEILSMGIPVITNSGIGDVDTIIKSSGTGLIVDRLEEKDFEAIMARIPEIVSLPAAKMKETALKYFSLEKGIDQYDKIYREITSIKELNYNKVG